MKEGGGVARAKALEGGGWKWVEEAAVEVGGRGRGANGARLGRKAAERRVFGKWPTRRQTRAGTRGAGELRGMWNPRLLRLALLQQLRAVHGIKVKGSHGQSDRRRQETAAAETVVSSGEERLAFICYY